jgi:hypothetical protein
MFEPLKPIPARLLSVSVHNVTLPPRDRRAARSLREPGSLIVGAVAAMALAFAILGIVL